MGALASLEPYVATLVALFSLVMACSAFVQMEGLPLLMRLRGASVFPYWIICVSGLIWLAAICRHTEDAAFRRCAWRWSIAFGLSIVVMTILYILVWLN